MGRKRYIACRQRLQTEKSVKDRNQARTTMREKRMIRNLSLEPLGPAPGNQAPAGGTTTVRCYSIRFYEVPRSLNQDLPTAGTTRTFVFTHDTRQIPRVNKT